MDPGGGAIPKAEAAGGEAEARLCFGDGGGRDGLSVQLPSQRAASGHSGGPRNSICTQDPGFWELKKEFI